MNYAIQTDSGLVIGSASVLWPEFLFPDGLPPDDFLLSVSGYKVSNDGLVVPALHRLAASDPYIEGGVVRTLKAVPMSEEEIVAPYMEAMDELFDSTAKSRRYDNRVTCALRAGYPGPFQAEGLAFAQWMDACNATGYAIMAEVREGLREIPTIQGFLDLLPTMEWPA